MISNNFNFLLAKNNGKTAKRGTGVLTIINSSNNGKRIIFSKQLEEDLGLCDRVQIALTPDNRALIIAPLLDETQTVYSIGRQDKRKPNSRLVLYNTKVVEEITTKMSLEYSGKVSITFYGIEYIEDDDIQYAKVWLGDDLA